MVQVLFLFSFEKALYSMSEFADISERFHILRQSRRDTKKTKNDAFFLTFRSLASSARRLKTLRV